MNKYDIRYWTRNALVSIFLQNQFLIQGATIFLLHVYSIILWQCFYNVLLFSVFHVFVLCKYDKSYILNIINIQCHEKLRCRTNARFLLFLIIYSSLVLVRIFGLVLTFWFNICLCVLFEVTRISHMSRLQLTLNMNL